MVMLYVTEHGYQLTSNQLLNKYVGVNRERGMVLVFLVTKYSGQRNKLSNVVLSCIFLCVRLCFLVVE